MKPEDARIIAEIFIASQEIHGFKTLFAKVNPTTRSEREFSVVFDMYSAEGRLCEEPTIVIVDKVARSARFLPTL